MGHTTLIVVLSDGSHRSVQWFTKDVKWTEVLRSMKEIVEMAYRHSVIAVSATLMRGTDTMTYNAAEVVDFTS